jgi:hypothetical protein
MSAEGNKCARDEIVLRVVIVNLIGENLPLPAEDLIDRQAAVGRDDADGAGARAGVGLDGKDLPPRRHSATL